jgi:hypothetical protein
VAAIVAEARGPMPHSKDWLAQLVGPPNSAPEVASLPGSAPHLALDPLAAELVLPQAVQVQKRQRVPHPQQVIQVLDLQVVVLHLAGYVAESHIALSRSRCQDPQNQKRQ